MMESGIFGHAAARTSGRLGSSEETTWRAVRFSTALCRIGNPKTSPISSAATQPHMRLTNVEWLWLVCI